MTKRSSRQPPSGAPEGTVWFGGPIDRWKVALRVHGEELDPDQVSALLGCQPSSSARKGNPFPRKGRWLLDIESKDCEDEATVNDGIKLLLARLPSDSEIWRSLSSMYSVDVFCGLFLEASNRMFGISPDVSRLLADRGLEVVFDVYIDPPRQEGNEPQGDSTSGN